MTGAGFTRRSEAAWAALTSCLARAPGRQVVVKDGPRRGASLAALWPFGQVLAAAAAAVPLGLVDLDTTVAPLLHAMERYRSAHGYGPFPGDHTRYYDDNAWIALDLLQLAAVTGDERYETAAAELFEFLEEGEAGDGGVRWMEGQTSRHTCSTGPAAQVALRLFLSSGERRYLDFGLRQMRFLDERLRDDAGLYRDNVGGDDEVEPTIWSYNQGTPIGAAALLARVGAGDDWLEHAIRVARAADAHFAADDGWWRQPPVFNAIHFRNVLALLAQVPDDDLLLTIDRYLDRVWTEARQPETGLFVDGGIGSYDGRPTIDQAGLAQLFAFRIWPPEHWRDIC